MGIRLCILRFLIIFSLIFSHCCRQIASQTDQTPTHRSLNVGVLLDFGTSLGYISNSCITTAVEDFYTNHDHEQYITRLKLHTRNSEDSLTGALFQAVELINTEKVQVIVGPQTSAQAEIVAEFGNKSQVPVVSFSATSPYISRSQMPYFVRMALNDSYQLEAIASIIQKFNWEDVILIFEETDYISDVIPNLLEVLDSKNVRVPHKVAISPKADDLEDNIQRELDKLLVMQTRVFLVHISDSLGSLFFHKVREVGLMTEGNAWIISEELTSVLGSMNYDEIDSMRGVMGIKTHIPRSTELQNLKIKMIPKIDQQSATMDNLNTWCLHAYDTIWAIAMAAERVSKNHIVDARKDYNDSTDLAGIGPQLLEEIRNSKFTGLSGDVHLINGQLRPAIFQIINVVGPGEREIGFWIPSVGFSHTPNGTSETNLRPIIWPGESTLIPRGWEIPDNRKKLKIGYLAKDPLAHTSRDRTSLRGYCIDIFDGVMKTLYDVPYEFVPIQKHNGEDEDSYEELIQQVHLQKYDAAIGGVTITANRSLYVGFTHPHTAGGVAMLIPVQYTKRKATITIFSPFTTGLWLLLFGGLCFVVVLPAHLSRKEPFLQECWLIVNQLYGGLSSFDIKKYTGLSRFIVILSILVFYFVCTLYSDKLKTMVTDGFPQLINIDVNDLRRNRDFVGYRKDSVVEMYLKKYFEPSQLRVYNSHEEYASALDKGTQKGGVAAIFDETPYIDVFLQNNCDQYRSIPVELLFRTAGHGFIFPKNSPLLPDVTKGVISFVQGDEMMKIERNWLEKCPQPRQAMSENEVTVDDVAGVIISIILTGIMIGGARAMIIGGARAMITYAGILIGIMIGGARAMITYACNLRAGTDWSTYSNLDCLGEQVTPNQLLYSCCLYIIVFFLLNYIWCHYKVMICTY